MSTLNIPDIRYTMLKVVSKYNCEEKHAKFVEKASLFIFDSLKSIHHLGDTEKLLLSHASLLHDIGGFINEKKHNKHTRYIIKNDVVLAEYPETEREMLSLVAYNHRKTIHKDTLGLPKDYRNVVLKLSSILRVADALDCTRDGVELKGVSVKGRVVRLTVEGVSPKKIEDRLSEKKDLFYDVFGMDVEVRE